MAINIVTHNMIKQEERDQKLQESNIIHKLTRETFRDEVLNGYTYKIKIAQDSPAWYITINNIEVGGVISPFELFISTKDMGNFEWISAIARLISAVFRRGGNVEFLVEELLAIHNPKGGYWGISHEGKKKRYYNSILNEVGIIIKLHLERLKVDNCSTMKEIIEVIGVDLAEKEDRTVISLTEFGETFPLSEF